jgi:Integrase core domain
MIPGARRALRRRRAGAGGRQALAGDLDEDELGALGGGVDGRDSCQAHLAPGVAGEVDLQGVEAGRLLVAVVVGDGVVDAAAGVEHQPGETRRRSSPGRWWRREYNAVRPHSGLGDRTPTEARLTWAPRTATLPTPAGLSQ